MAKRTSRTGEFSSNHKTFMIVFKNAFKYYMTQDWLIDFVIAKKFKSSRWFPRKCINNQFILIAWYLALGIFSSVLVPDENIDASEKSTCAKITEPTRTKSTAKAFCNHVAAEWNFRERTFTTEARCWLSREILIFYSPWERMKS